MTAGTFVVGLVGICCGLGYAVNMWRKRGPLIVRIALMSLAVAGVVLLVYDGWLVLFCAFLALTINILALVVTTRAERRARQGAL